jgi:hypothetical protein
MWAAPATGSVSPATIRRAVASTTLSTPHRRSGSVDPRAVTAAA